MQDQDTPPATPAVPGGQVLRISAVGSPMRDAAIQVSHEVAEARATRAAAKRAGKPTLTEATVVEFVDWVAVQLVGDAISGGEASILLKAAELVISKTHAAAQAKATEHTLIEEGVLPADQA